jgi:hypothetical protein
MELTTAWPIDEIDGDGKGAQSKYGEQAQRETRRGRSD